MDPDASPTSETGSTSVTSEQSSSSLSHSESSEIANSTDELASVKSHATASSNGNDKKIKSILNNPNDTLPRKQTRARSDSGFRAALKSTFLPPPVPGRQIKVKDGKPLGKSYLRCEPLPEAFEGGEVLPYDPRGEDASAGDGVIPPECLMSPSDRKSSFSDAGDSTDCARSVTGESEISENSGSSQGNATRGRQISSTMGRNRNDSVASTSSSSGSAAIKFAPLPLSGRLKRANSISIGVAARSQLLQSQGTAAPPRQRVAPQHLHNSQDWYTDGSSTRTTPEGVLDVGEELRKGASKAWKLLRGGTSSANTSTNTTPATEAPDTNIKALPEPPKKHFPKEGAPVPDPETGELRMAGGEAVGHTPKLTSTISDSGEHDKGDKTPRRLGSPTEQFGDLSIDEDRQSDAAAAIEAAHRSNIKKGSRGHDPHELQDGEHEETFHLAEEPDSHIDSGAATPRSAQRRLSTGGFLRGFSIRGIQEDRRRDLLGLDDDEDTGSGREGSDHHRHGFTVRGPSGKEEELDLEGYGHSRPQHEGQQAS